MGQAEELMARVRQLPEIIGKTDTELAETCGVSPQQWSNYKAEGKHNNELPWRAALCLSDMFGIPMEWLYGGQLGAVADPKMREKLALAERRARAWLAGRRGGGSGGGSGGRSKSRIGRAAIISLAGAFLLLGHSNGVKAWKSTSDLPIDSGAFAASKAICKGGAMKAIAGAVPAVTNPQNWNMMADAMVIIYRGCMASHGYMASDEN